MSSRLLNRLLGFGALSVAALSLSLTSMSAEQIRLTDGRIIQGDVVGAVTEEGFRFKLTSTGGEAYFRWSQINREDEARLRNIKDPDADLVLIVYVNGDRLNRDVGDPVEGKVEVTSEHYLVKNLRYPHGMKVPLDEVVEGADAIQRNVLIDARVVMAPDAVLALRENEAPPETAQDWYAAARLAEHLGLFHAAQERLQRCLDLAPTSKLLASAESMKGRVDELIKQEAVLQLLDLVRGLANKDQYAYALHELGQAAKGERGSVAPTGAIKDAMDKLFTEVDAQYTKWIVNEWHDEAYSAIRRWVKDNRTASANEGLTFARRAAEQELLKSMVIKVRGDADARLLPDNTIANDIRKRMRSRLEGEDTKRLRERTADFTKDGWYQAVGGNLPNQGKQRPANQQPGQQPGQQPNPRDQRFPPGARGGNSGGGGGVPGRGGSDFSPEFGGNQFAPQGAGGGAGGGAGEKKEGDKPAEGIGDVDAERIAEIARRIIGAGQNRDGGQNQPQNPDGPRGPQAQYKDDDTRWTDIPAVVPPLQDWWAKQGDMRKIKWLMAAYCRDGRTMDIVRENYHRFTYR